MEKLPHLTTRRLGRQLLHLDEVSSTNTYCKEHADCLSHGAAVIADYQSGGKGRLGKKWNGGRGSGLYLSVLLKDQQLHNLTILPLLVGLAVCKALEAETGHAFSLKWSNDVLFEGKKICGILCESRILQENPVVVAGLGINVLHTEEELCRLNLVYAASLLSATQKKYEILPLAAAVLNVFEPILEKFAAEGFSGLKEEYCTRCVTLGRQVRVQLDGEPRSGMAVDIAEDGSLICEIDGMPRHIHAGETSVRGIYGYV